MALFLGIFTLLLLAQSALAKSLVPIGSVENRDASLSDAVSTQDVTIISDTTISIAGEEDVSELEILTKDGTWRLTLRRNKLLGDSDTLQRVLHEIPNFHQGVVADDKESWVRLSTKTIDGVQTYDGFIERGGQLYRLYLPRLTTDHLQTQDGRAVHKLTQIGQSDIVFPDTLRSRNTIPQAVTRAARIGIALDSRFDEFHNGRGLARALTIINGVDGLYQSQFGLALIVDSIRVYDDPTTDPLREQPGDVTTLLSAFRTTRLTDAELPTNLALVHLFTGHQDPTQVIGLGWIDTACRNDGFDVSMSTPFPFDMLLAAHEIAHNLGAVHDDDVECQISGDAFPSNVMWSQLSGATTTEFSSCSLQRVLPTLERGCFAENIDVNVSLFASGISSSLERRIEVQVSNSDLTRSAAGLTTETRFPDSTILTNASAGCSIAETNLLCRHSTLEAGERDVVSVSAILASFDDQLVVAQINTEQFEDAQDTDNRAALNVLEETSSALSGVPAEDAINNSDTGSSGGSAGIGGVGIWLLSALGLMLIRRNTKVQAGNSKAA